MHPTFKEGIVFGHYVVDGECVACGHPIGELEQFTFVVPPLELWWDEEDLPRVPEVLKLLS